MITKTELKSLAEKAVEAKCPKDLFGDEPPKREYLDEILKELKSAKLPQGYDYAYSRLEIIVNWTIQVLRFKFLYPETSYSKGKDHLLVISIAVQEFEGCKMFRLNISHVGTKAKSTVAFFYKIPVAFHGYYWSDRYEILRGGNTLEKGRVTYYGTHDATEVFMSDSTGIRYGIEAHELAVGDVINIYTVKYLSANQFLQMVM